MLKRAMPRRQLQPAVAASWIAPIDGLRGLAALTVVVGHLMAASWGIGWIPTASLAVVLFFGISGFLIFYLFEIEHQASGL